jgi:ATP-binding cassette, subfamily C (CFTR/MRP), member 1
LSVSELVLTCISTGWLTLAIPLIILVLYFVQKVYLRTTRQVRLLDLEAKSPVFSHFISSFSGLVTIRAFNWTKEVHEENLKHLDLSQRPFYLLYSLQRWLTLVLDLIMAGLAVLLISLTVALRESVDPGLLGVALVSVMRFGQLLGYLLNYWANLETSLGAVARVRQFEGETPQEVDGTGEPEPDWPPKGRICLENVSASYGDRIVLHDIMLDFEPGEKIAICGRTGSGKSTLLALLLRLYEPLEGRIHIDGVEISDMSLSRLRKDVVALPQDPLFLSGTIRYNLDPFQAVNDEDIGAALQKTGLKALIEDKGGLGADLNTGWLSAGQKQLFCMARALLRSSRVLLLDEATSR